MKIILLLFLGLFICGCTNKFSYTRTRDGFIKVTAETPWSFFKADHVSFTRDNEDVLVEVNGVEKQGAEKYIEAVVKAAIEAAR